MNKIKYHNEKDIKIRFQGSQLAIDAIIKQLKKFTNNEDEEYNSQINPKQNEQDIDQQKDLEKTMLEQLLKEQEAKQLQAKIDELNNEIVKELEKKQLEEQEKEVIIETLEKNERKQKATNDQSFFTNEKGGEISNNYFANLNKSLDKLQSSIEKCHNSGLNISFTFENNQKQDQDLIISFNKEKWQNNLQNTTNAEQNIISDDRQYKSSWQNTKNPNSHLPNTNNNDKNINR